MQFHETTPLYTGAERQNPVQLNAHNWIMDELPPWNQPHILERPKSNDPWRVRVTEAGRYTFTLQERPEIAGFPVTANSARLYIEDMVDEITLVYLFDIFPTLAELCGLPEPEGIDGANLNPVISGETEGVRDALYTAYRNTARSVRTPDGWKLISYPRRNFMQLFQLENDPLELNNLAENPEFQQKLNEMKTLLEEWHQATDDTATLYPATFLSLEYDYPKLKQTPDRHQPEYVLERYFQK